MDNPPDALDEVTWHERRAAHESRVDTWVRPHLRRREQRRSHPVEDFLFTYYSQSPTALRRWHPGFGWVLTGPGASSYHGLKGYVDVADGVTVAQEYVAARQALISSVADLLRATAGRPAQLGCFGMHEWAMVYRASPDQVRHSAWPLRLGSGGTDAVVEGHRITCTHYDAFRFFTPPARPRNTPQPGRDDRLALEQPGCLHVGMDLYKHAFRLTPLVCSELVADCFELARDIRVLDMRASPYDLTGLGYSPVRVETTEGKQEYVAAQHAFALRGVPLRQRLIGETARLLDVPRARGLSPSRRDDGAPTAQRTRPAPQARAADGPPRDERPASPRPAGPPR